MISKVGKYDAGNILVGKVNDKKAIVIGYDFDMDQMAARVGDPEFAKLIENDVESHDFYVLQEMKLPSE